MDEDSPRTILMTANTVDASWDYAVAMARAMSRRKTSIALATFGDSLSAAQRKDADALPNLHLFPSRQRSQYPPEISDDQENAGKWLLRLESQVKPDIIQLHHYTHGLLPWSAPCIVVAESCIRVWWRTNRHAPLPSRIWSAYRLRVQQSFRRVKLLVAPTRSMVFLLARNYGTLPPTRVIPHGLPHLGSSRTRKLPIVFSAFTASDAPAVLEELDHAATGSPWQFFAASRGGSSVRPTAYRHISHCGDLPGSAVEQWTEAAAIFCMPAHFDPCGLSVLSAGLAGCALVISDTPEHRELWHGAAIFVQPGDGPGLRRTVQALIKDPNLRTTYQRAARLRASRYCSDKMAEAYLRVYRELTPRESPAAGPVSS